MKWLKSVFPIVFRLFDFWYPSMAQVDHGGHSRETSRGDAPHGCDKAPQRLGRGRSTSTENQKILLRLLVGKLLNYIEIWVVNGVQTLYANLIVLMVVFHRLCGSGVYSTHMPTKWFIWHLWVSFILLQDLQYASWPSAGFPPLWSSDTARWGLSDRCLLSSIVLPRNLLHPFQASKTEISLVFWLVCSRAGHQWMAWRKVLSFWCWY